MEKDQSRRYESANDLAADLQRYLAGEPVLACLPSTVYRLTNFTRRNKAVLAVIFLVIVGLSASLAGLAVGNSLIGRERDAADMAREEERLQRLRADENLQQTGEAVERLFTQVSETRLLDEPGVQPLRKELLENAVDFYQSWINRGGAAPDVTLELANIRLRLGTIYLQSASLNDACVEFEHAFELTDGVLTDMPLKSDEFRRLAGFYPGIRVTPGCAVPRPSQQNRFDAMLQWGAALWRLLADAHPDVAGLRRDPVFFSDRDDLRDLVRRYPGDKELGAELGILIQRSGYFKEDPGLMWEGIAHLAEADLSVHRGELAIMYHDLGWRLLSQGQYAEATVELSTAVTMFWELAREFPHITDCEFHAVGNTADLARALAKSGQIAAAEQLAADVVCRTGKDFVLRGNIYREIEYDEKAIADYDRALAAGLRGQVPSIARVGNFPSQHADYEKAILFYNHGIQTNTSKSVSRIYADRGACRARMGQYDRALEDFIQSIEINAGDCEHHLSRLPTVLLLEGTAEFRVAYLKLTDRAIEITEGNGQSFIARSYVQLALGNREAAKADLARGIQLDPDYNFHVALRPLLNELSVINSSQ